MKHLSRADEILLLSIACLGDEAFSTTILQEMAQRGGKRITVGSLWVSLDQLTEKGYLRKTSSAGKSRHGGRPRIYYRLTPRGVRILLRMRDFQKSLWKGVPNLEKYDAS